jgi:hypothetical protein
VIDGQTATHIIASFLLSPVLLAPEGIISPTEATVRGAVNTEYIQAAVMARPDSGGNTRSTVF